MGTGTDHRTEEPRRAAAEWVARLDGGRVTAEDMAAFRAWAAADPCHAEAFEEAYATWQHLEAPGRALAQAQRARTAALLDRAHRRATWRGGGRLRAWRPALAWLLAVACVGAVLWLFYPEFARWADDAAADIATRPGQTRVVQLPDGSSLHLGGDTAVALDFGASRRSLRLLRGEAFVEVRSGQALSFEMTAGRARIRVRGTSFNVERCDDGVEIVVRDGHVEVAGAAGPDLVHLQAGDRVMVNAGRLGPVSRADLDGALAWRNGRLVFYRATLAHVVARLERQQSGRIVVVRGAARNLRISGAFPAGDVDGTLTAIADTLGMRVVSVTPWLTALY